MPLIDHRNHPRLHLLFAEPVLNLCVCYCIARYTECPKTFGGRLLNNRGLAWLGRLSYSLYVWQQFFLCEHGTAFVQRFPINIILAFCCALLSYAVVEKPLAKLRKRLRPAPTTAWMAV
jgi:peptidoglycan/LPS O-acetylase OafA/YrhL